MMPSFRVHTADNIEDVIGALALDPERTAVLAGGTDLLVALRGGRPQVRHLRALVDVTGVAELGARGRDPDGSLWLGAGTTHARVVGDGGMPPVLREACAAVGSPQIRNRGTLGGNVVNAAPCADALTALVALDARARLRAAAGEREVPVTALVGGPYRSTIGPGELLVGFRVPAQGDEPQVGAFEKVGRREALAIARVSVAVVLGVCRGKVTRARLVPGAVLARVHSVGEVERMLQGERVTSELAREVGERVRALVDTETGVRWSTPYKGPVLAALCSRAVLRAARQAEGSRER